MLRENLGATPDLVESVIEWRRRNPDDVRLPEIAFNSRGFESCKELFRPFVDKDGKLTPMLVRLGRSNDVESLGRSLLQEELKVARQSERLGTECVHATCFVKDR